MFLNFFISFYHINKVFHSILLFYQKMIIPIQFICMLSALLYYIHTVEAQCQHICAPVKTKCSGRFKAQELPCGWDCCQK